MDKERDIVLESGYSEVALDKNANIVSDKTQNQVKAVSIFDSAKKKKEEKDN